MNYLLVVIGAALFALSIALILGGSFYRERRVFESATTLLKIFLLFAMPQAGLLLSSAG